MYKEILKQAQKIQEELVEIRRDLHRHPEISGCEVRTSKIVAEKLRAMGLEVKEQVGGNGVVAVLKGSGIGEGQGQGERKTIMLRADMDCLKIQEDVEVEFKSENLGYMHACGHDAHTAWLLGAAKILCNIKEDICGNVKFVFQPAEEISEGAMGMIKDGVLENPKVDAVIGCHIWPYIESGKMGVKYGSLMAASDKFKVTIYGKGGHGGQPEKCIDPIAIACEMYMAFQTIVSRMMNPLDPAVITIGKFNAGTAHNVIPEEAFLEGTVRSMSHEARSKIPTLMENIIKGMTRANGASYDFQYIAYHPPVINDNEMTNLMEAAVVDMFGKNNLVKLVTGSMAGEDFADYQEKVPGVFFWVGTLNSSIGADKPLHSPDFCIDESVIHKAAAMMAYSAYKYLKENW